jgi:hypothetical protein
MRYFLIVYDRKARQIIDFREYESADRDAALADLFEREIRERLQPDLEVVLLTAESQDALRHTHRRYFMRDEPFRVGAS